MCYQTVARFLLLSLLVNQHLMSVSGRIRQFIELFKGARPNRFKEDEEALARFNSLVESERIRNKNDREHNRSRRLLSSPSNTNRFKEELISALVGGLGVAIWYFTATSLLKSIERSISKFSASVRGASQQIPSKLIPYLEVNSTLSSHELEIAESVLVPSEIKDADFQSIGGLEELKLSLWDCVQEYSRDDFDIDQSESIINSRVKGVLLYGPPGCGKTLITRAVGRKASLPIISITPSLLLRKWVGETSQLIKAVFTLAEKLQPCMLFVDEMDSLFRARRSEDASHDRNLQTEFMQLWDSLLYNNTRVIVFGATNRPQDIDPAVQRRFERSFLLRLPDEVTRGRILQLLVGGTNGDAEGKVLNNSSSLDLARLAKATKGYAASDLQSLCKAAVQISLRRARRRNENATKQANAQTKALTLQTSDFDEALKIFAPIQWSAQRYGEEQDHSADKGTTMGMGPKPGSSNPEDDSSSFEIAYEPEDHDESDLGDENPYDEDEDDY